jgi:uncharacterized protein GlcG (DUF336 family)
MASFMTGLIPAAAAAVLHVLQPAPTPVSAVAAGSQAASGPLVQKNVSLEQAGEIVRAAIEFCKESDPRISIAVLDREGIVRLLVRTNGANPHNLDLARRKAYTAKTFKMPSADWAKRTAPGADVEAQRDLEGPIALGGGVPIMIGTDAIGAVGVSGNSQTQDEACARAGIAKIQDQLK